MGVGAAPDAAFVGRLDPTAWRSVAFPVVAVIERHELFVALAHLHRGRAFAGHSRAGIVTRTAGVERGVLRYRAIQVSGGPIGVVLEGRGALLLRGKEAGGAYRWRI
jgi:hypothetical protein